MECNTGLKWVKVYSSFYPKLLSLKFNLIQMTQTRLQNCVVQEPFNSLTVEVEYGTLVYVGLVRGRLDKIDKSGIISHAYTPTEQNKIKAVNVCFRFGIWFSFLVFICIFCIYD